MVFGMKFDSVEVVIRGRGHAEGVFWIAPVLAHLPVVTSDWGFSPSSTSGIHRGDHRIDIGCHALAARVGHIARVVAVPVGASADGASVFHGVTLSRLELRVGEEHHHAVAASSGPTTAASTCKFGALVGADDRAVRFENLDGVAMLRVDFQ